MKLKSKWPVRRFFAFLGALYLFCAVTPLLFAESGTAKSESVFRFAESWQVSEYGAPVSDALKELLIGLD